MHVHVRYDNKKKSYNHNGMVTRHVKSTWLTSDDPASREGGGVILFLLRLYGVLKINF